MAWQITPYHYIIVQIGKCLSNPDKKLKHDTQAFKKLCHDVQEILPIEYWKSIMESSFNVEATISINEKLYLKLKKNNRSLSVFIKNKKETLLLPLFKETYNL